MYCCILFGFIMSFLHNVFFSTLYMCVYVVPVFIFNVIQPVEPLDCPTEINHLLNRFHFFRSESIILLFSVLLFIVAVNFTCPVFFSYEIRPLRIVLKVNNQCSIERLFSDRSRFATFILYPRQVFFFFLHLY